MTLHHGNTALALCCFMLALSSAGDGLADTLFKQGSEQSKALNRCALLSKAGVLPVKNVTALPDDGAYRVLRIDVAPREFIVFIYGHGDRAACLAFEVIEPVAKTRGVFWPGKPSSEAILIRGSVCNEQAGCPSMIAFRRPRGPVYAAVRRDGCPQGERLKQMVLFGGRQHSLRIECRHGLDDGGFDALVSISHVFDGKASSVASFELGVGRIERQPPKRGSQKVCVTQAPGWLKVARRGSVPQVRVYQPMSVFEERALLRGSGAGRSAVEPIQPKLLGRQSMWQFDPQQRRFVEQEALRKQRPYRLRPLCRRQRVAVKPRLKKAP